MHIEQKNNKYHIIDGKRIVHSSENLEELQTILDKFFELQKEELTTKDKLIFGLSFVLLFFTIFFGLFYGL